MTDERIQIVLEAKNLIENVELPNNPKRLRMDKFNYKEWLPQIALFFELYNKQIPWIAWAGRGTNGGLGVSQLMTFLNKKDNYIDFLVKDDEIIAWVWQYRYFSDILDVHERVVAIHDNQVYSSKWFVPRHVRLNKKYKNLPIQWINWLNNDLSKRSMEGIAYVDRWNKNALKACLRGGYKIKKWF